LRHSVDPMSHPDASLDRTYDPATGNLLMRFVRPGAQRIEHEAPPMVHKDIGFTHSANSKN